jgi:integrase
MTKLISEGLFTDGSFQLSKVLEQTNDRLGKLGKHGKRAKLKQSKNSIVLQFSFEGKQHQKGINCSFTKGGIIEAEKIAGLVTSQLSASSFTWEWFNNLIGKKVNTEETKSTCKQLISQYKTHWFQENKKLKKPDKGWYQRFKYIEETFLEHDSPLSSCILKQAIEQTSNNTCTRTYILQALTLFLEYFDISEYDKLIQSYKTKNNPTPKKRNVPSDSKIKYVFHTGFELPIRGNQKYLYRYPQWQFLYGLLAVYGLRIHEAWNIANWDKPVILHQGDWLVVEEGLGEQSDKYERHTGSDFIVPAVLDPANKDKILCIKHNTKTGYRMAMPLSPLGENWLEEFGLIRPFNLPDVKNPLGTVNRSQTPNCTSKTGQWFLRHKYGFTPHDLRHAYNHRGHCLGYNPTLLSKSLGHSLQMNSTTYLKTMPDDRTLQMFLEASQQEKDKQSELERLKSEVELLRQENERLKTEANLYKSLLEQVRSR